MDRLRAVRQDMVIQNLTAADYISLLQPMIIIMHSLPTGWLIFFINIKCDDNLKKNIINRLCEENRDVFDPVINKKHLEECLKRLLTLYDEWDCLQKRYHQLKIDRDLNFDLIAEDRPFFEALYILLNLGDTIALTRALELPQKIR